VLKWETYRGTGAVKCLVKHVNACHDHREKVKRKGPTAQPAEIERVGTEIGEIGAKAWKSDDNVRR
jgi:hypothetical protein